MREGGREGGGGSGRGRERKGKNKKMKSKLTQKNYRENFSNFHNSSLIYFTFYLLPKLPSKLHPHEKLRILWGLLFHN